MEAIDSLILNEDEKVEIQKHSATVQISNKITAQQRKIYNALLHVSKSLLEENKNRQTFFVKQSHLKRLCGDQSTNNKQLQDNLKGLMSTIVEFNILKKDNTRLWHASTLLAEATIDNGRVYFAFGPTVKKTLLKPDYYVLLDLNIIKGLQSKYAIALYENARDYSKLGIPKMTLETFREIMGIDKKKYKSFSDLKKRVIEPSVDEINSKTDLKISYELFKDGRRYKYIKFKVENRQLVKIDDVKNSNGDFIVNIDDFINYVRQKYIPNPEKDSFPTISIYKGQELRVDLQGYLYMFNTQTSDIIDLNGNETREAWFWLFENQEKMLKIEAL
jgi:plasmid replication initiation protein